MLKTRTVNDRLIIDIPERYRGLKELSFYLTDCRKSLFVRGGLQSERVVFFEEDERLIQALFKVGTQVYLFREQLVYLQKKADGAELVIDYLDGQAFVRIPMIYDFRVNLLNDNRLKILLIAGFSNLINAHDLKVDVGNYRRKFKGAGYIEKFTLYLDE